MNKIKYRFCKYIKNLQTSPFEYDLFGILAIVNNNLYAISINLPNIEARNIPFNLQPHTMLVNKIINLKKEKISNEETFNFPNGMSNLTLDNPIIVETDENHIKFIIKLLKNNIKFDNKTFLTYHFKEEKFDLEITTLD